MFQSRDKLEEEFNRPVESIMKCEDFKSNFARRLSNRYISRSPVSPTKQDTSLKLSPIEYCKTEDVSENVTESIGELSKSCSTETSGEAAKPSVKTSLKTSELQGTQVTALNMEVETLRWQLAQTEANRQMHIALLRQLVTFLNRVKDHIERQSNESNSKQEKPSTKRLPRSFNFADLPRSRSVVHVNKNIEYPLSNPKKSITKKISKSISNVNGYKDCGDLWNQSKLSLTSETEATYKMSEEISRLIILASTVLSTKIPDLAYTCNDNLQETNIAQIFDNTEKEDLKSNGSIDTLSPTPKYPVNGFVLKPICDSVDEYNAITNKFIDPKHNKKLNEYMIISPPMRPCDLGNEFPSVKLHKKESQNTKNKFDSTIIKTSKASVDKRNDYSSSTFIEDESGFSSMSSFQEIGIPIINIIPPSPCKEIRDIKGIPDILEEAEKWNTDAMDIETQRVKVFWV